MWASPKCASAALGLGNRIMEKVNEFLILGLPLPHQAVKRRPSRLKERVRRLSLAPHLGGVPAGAGVDAIHNASGVLWRCSRRRALLPFV